ncbi:MAG: hypothetical protein ABMB14_13990 [Myxococcota bacterium]
MGRRARTEAYAAKLLVIDPGHRTSLKHHDRKAETLLVLDVEAEVERDGRLERRHLVAGNRLHLPGHAAPPRLRDGGAPGRGLDPRARRRRSP